MNFALDLHKFWLLGDLDRLQSMGNRFRGRSAEFHFDDLLTGLLLVALAALGVYVLSRLRARQEKRGSYHHPWALFHELCKAHKLDRPSCKLLRELARWQKLDQPARLFLEPERYEPASLSPRLAAQSETLQALRERLIGPLDASQTCQGEATPESTAAPHARLVSEHD